jgi:ATP-dependent helicase/nuclease subunit B
MRRNVFTIGPGVPFLATFVDAFLNGGVIASLSRDSAPLDIARTTLYVPTQRAGRALAAEFARAIDKPSALLPRILPLGGLDEQENVALFDAGFDMDESTAPAIGEIERRLILAQLVTQWANALRHAIVSIDPTGAPVLDEREIMLVAASPANAYALAGELGALIDEFIIEAVDPRAIHRLTDEAFDQYWAITTHFLQIALHQWPGILAERGLCDLSARRQALIEAQIALLSGSGAPVVALGSTGANPATARLLKTIAAMEKGAVILPGLDRDIDEDAWARIGHADGDDDEPAFTHPQAVLKRLLTIMETRRDEARELGAPTRELNERRAFVSQAFRPADTTENWRHFRAERRGEIANALTNLTYIEAADERMEALALALFMREALDTPARTAALITPDRDIARRVAAELARFNIEIDDSGGKPLASTSIGALARLAAQIAQDGLTAANVAALLAHPLTGLNLARSWIEALAPLVEIGVLRVLGRAESGWAHSVANARELALDWRAHPAAQRIGEADWRAIEDVLARIEAAVAALAALPRDAELSARVTAHRDCLEAITATEDGGAAGEGVEELLSLFGELTRANAPLVFDAASYASFFDRIAYETVIRGPRRAHPRLKILGPLEARLLDADLVLLAGLDETVWPPRTDTGAFLNRSMRRQLGLTPPERRIGQSAHDFMMALGANNVVVSRSVKRNGSPTVASRFITRVRALAGEAFDACKKRGDKMLAIAAALDRPNETKSLERPLPRPPVELRPTQLSVTRIETLRRDPYAIYAERILRLVPLSPLGAEKGAREIGTAIHEALADFSRETPRGPLPADARARLLGFARQRLRAFLEDPAFLTFSWPRLEAGLDHALSFEGERRELNGEIFIEESGAWNFALADGSAFRLTCQADRIEIGVDGAASVFDYKTGAPPSLAQVGAGFAPQLTLEAAMIEAGAMPAIGKRLVDSAAYVRLGGADGGGSLWLKWKDKSFSDVVAEHRTQLLTLLSQFRELATPYPSRPFVAFASRYGDYDHLARVKEWSRGAGEEDA